MSATNDSSTGGPLLPVENTVMTDDQVSTVLQQLVVGITGLGGTLVVPRWQTNPPTRPPATADWCAIGVSDTDPAPGLPYTKLAADGNSTLLSQQWVIQALASFYGPNAQFYAGLLVSGLFVKQNLDAIYAVGMKLREIGAVTKSAELVNTQWYGRADVTIVFTYQIDRIYPIKAFNAASIQLVTERGALPIDVYPIND